MVMAITLIKVKETHFLEARQLVCKCLLLLTSGFQTLLLASSHL